jgi:hypothetical protein
VSDEPASEAVEQQREGSTDRSLPEALEALRDRLHEVRLDLEVTDIDKARAARREIVNQVDDYLLPRLARLDAPLLAVVGGSTGAGKSTLVNSLVGAEVSRAGVLRPTTRAPVLVCHPADGRWFRDDRILPDLPRTTGRPASDARALHIVVDEDVPAGIALLDAPDIDSVEESNRRLADQLLAAADLWIFVTTAARYADAVPWDLLRRAQERTTALAIVLNRVPSEALSEVPSHLAALLRKGGLERAPLLVVPETQLEEGLIPADALAEVDRWLGGLARDAAERASLVRMTLEGALDSLDERTGIVVRVLRAQSEVASDLIGDVDAAYARSLRDVEDSLSGGVLLRGEVLARWQEVVGTGDFMRSLEAGIGRVRDRVKEALLGQPSATTQVRDTLGSSVESLVVAGADRAAERVLEAWRARPAGTALLAAGNDDLARSSSDLPARTAVELRSWQGRVLELVAAEGASKRAAGRVLSLGINGVGVALMVAVFAQTAGLSGGELLIAGGTATLSQKLLEALFGDQAVRDLTARARTDLVARIQALFEAEALRYRDLVQRAAPSPAHPESLATDLAALAAARRSR